jgi:hypothetical protein
MGTLITSSMPINMSNEETMIVYFHASLWTDPYTELQDYPKLKAAILTIGILILSIGNLMLYGIVLFERFGGDPQKRSILNQV